MTYYSNPPLEIVGIAWDAGSQKHGVSIEEVEALCRDPTFAIRPDRAHSATELRFQGIGRTARGRHVFLVFTLREHEGKTFLRPIGARYMHAREVHRYEQNNSGLQDR